MIQIDDKIISLELYTEQFCCDLGACHGECCVEGNAGAPLEAEEVDDLEQHWAEYKPYMTTAGIKAVEEQGFMVVDMDGDLTTPLVNDAECAYTIQENGTTWCAIEKAWSLGECSFRKPISCHLYPIRVVPLGEGLTGLQYHRWDVCSAARVLGRTKGEPLYRTLREPLVRAYGPEFFEAMEQCETELREQGYLKTR